METQCTKANNNELIQRNPLHEQNKYRVRLIFAMKNFQTDILQMLRYQSMKSKSSYI
jgi:autonomous glycyl radical cofactor GrcA